MIVALGFWVGGKHGRDDEGPDDVERIVSHGRCGDDDTWHNEASKLADCEEKDDNFENSHSDLAHKLRGDKRKPGLCEDFPQTEADKSHDPANQCSQDTARNPGISASPPLKPHENENHGCGKKRQTSPVEVLELVAGALGLCNGVAVKSPLWREVDSEEANASKAIESEKEPVAAAPADRIG